MNHHQGNRDTDDPIYHQADLILSLNRETQTPYSSLGENGTRTFPVAAEMGRGDLSHRRVGVGG